MKRHLIQSIEQSLQVIAQLKLPHNLLFMEEAAKMLASCFRKGNKVIIAGNGGSLCDAAHFAEELTGRFRETRRALPAIALSEPGHITCTGNDFGFEWVFSRGVEAFGRPDDIFIGLSTSGNSPNIIRAFEKAQMLDLKTIAFLGKEGGKMKGMADIELIIESPTGYSDRVQEAHMTVIHIIIEMMELQLFSIKKTSEAILTTV